MLFVITHHDAGYTLLSWVPTCQDCTQCLCLRSRSARQMPCCLRGMRSCAERVSVYRSHGLALISMPIHKELDLSGSHVREKGNAKLSQEFKLHMGLIAGNFCR